MDKLLDELVSKVPGENPGFHFRGWGEAVEFLREGAGAAVISLKTHPPIYKYGKSAKLRGMYADSTPPPLGSASGYLQCTITGDLLL